MKRSDKIVLGVVGAIAIGLGLVATPAAALLALTATSRNEGENRCEAVLKEVQQAPMAQKPAKKS